MGMLAEGGLTTTTCNRCLGTWHIMPAQRVPPASPILQLKRKTRSARGFSPWRSCAGSSTQRPRSESGTTRDTSRPTSLPLRRLCACSPVGAGSGSAGRAGRSAQFVPGLPPRGFGESTGQACPSPSWSRLESPGDMPTGMVSRRVPRSQRPSQEIVPWRAGRPVAGFQPRGGVASVLGGEVCPGLRGEPLLCLTRPFKLRFDLTNGGMMLSLY
jgi:hypothetical protein